MGPNRHLTTAKEKFSNEASLETDSWEDVLPLISRGAVIPIISNAFCIEQIFREGSKATEEENTLTIHEQLTSEWANGIGYPMQDKHNLARVVQYYLEEQEDFLRARAGYFDFLKSSLLTIASGEEGYADLAHELERLIHGLRFSEVAHQLDFPRLPENTDDLFRLLARFPLPIYVTTSPSDFLERALEAEGKRPKTQVCFWSGDSYSANPEHQADPSFRPTVVNPLIYHLYGLEDYPQTLVLSEDDYMNFLVSIVKDTDTLNPIIPLNLRGALSESHLLFLGYQLSSWDWDFRVLFQVIMDLRQRGFSRRGMVVVQLRLDKSTYGHTEKALDYLTHYFNKRNFDIEWNTAESFIQKLWKEWDTYRKSST